MPAQLIQLIQRQVPIGSRVTFSLKSGRQVSGTLVELGRDHVTVQINGSLATVLVDMIGAWEVMENEPSAPIEETARVEVLESEEAPGTERTDHPVNTTAEQFLTSDSVEPEILKRLIEIEARFQAKLQAAKIEIKAPDFAFPADEFKGQHRTDAVTLWSRIKDKYEYAAKINELSAKFGRIQPIINDLQTLADWFPTAPVVKRHLAYFNWLSGNERKATEYYKDAAVASSEGHDWYNVAVLALKNGQEALACYGLEQFFHHASVTEEANAWYIYIGLLNKFCSYSTLAAWLETTKRDFSEAEERILLQTGIYLLQVTERKELAEQLVRKWEEGQPPKVLALGALKQLDGQPDGAYQQAVSRLSTEREARKKLPLIETSPQSNGHIYKYLPARNFGFLRGGDGGNYFFHRSAIVDDELFDRIGNLKLGEQIPVVFETAQGPKGPLAVGVSLYRTIDEMFELAIKYANDGEYPKAIAQVRKVLALNLEYPAAQESYEKWREYARVTGVPRGSNPYARAKRVQLIEKDLERAAQLLQTAIKQGDNVESAIKDLAALLDQQGRPQEAIDLLMKNRKRISDQQSVDNMLVGLYRNARQDDQVIALLAKRLAQASTGAKKAQILWQIANNYLRQEDYVQAEQSFREVLKWQSDNKAAQRNLAICLFKQQRFDEAEKILNRILDTSPDAQAAELFEAITQAKMTGQSAQIDEIIIETTLSDFSGETSGFTQFFLDRCEFEGVPPHRVQNRLLDRSDIRNLEGLAEKLGPRRPRDRSDYYLSAARIISLIEEGDDPSQFYRYLCRSFASRGDATVIENRPLDSARELYCEALSVYDGDRSQRKVDDAKYALVRFLFSTLGQAQIPMSDIPSIDEAIETVLNRHPQRDRVFSAIAYLIFRSRYAANRILKPLHSKSTLQAMALEYLKSKNVSIPGPIKQLDDFVRIWNELRRKSFDEVRTISNELRFLKKVELTTASLEGSIERIKKLEHSLFFDLDQQRIRQLQQILEVGLDLRKQHTFEEQERLCFQIDTRCQDLLKEIEDNPTKLSVEELYSIIQVVQKKAAVWLEELYESSAPQLSLRLPVESYTPDNHRQIEVQITIANRMGRSPAESLELVVQEDEDFFVLSTPEITLDSSLRGGDQQILRVPIRVSEQALLSQTFSLPVYAQYRTRSGEITQTPVNNFSIRLYSEEEFEEIENPYAAYAEGGVVGNPEMFYGREELIENAASAIQGSRAQSKCIVIFGQKRAGKSSILYHLKDKLQTDKDLLILDLGNIGSLLDEHSQVPLLYQILWSILNKLEYAIEDRAEKSFTRLNLSFPNTREFYEHPSPLVFFKEVFERYERNASKLEDWRNVHSVLLIDEFSYIYGQIVSGRIPEQFMKNWKALLQENYFSAVLAGQDVMPKFKQRFPNEFGTTQDERVSYLRREDAVRLIDEPISIGGRQGESRYRERAIERILDLTAGSPFYIQIICNRLVEYMNRKHARLVTDADVEQVKNELVQGVNALGLDKFDNLINSGDTSEDAISDQDALQVLKAIAMNSQIGPCSRSSIVCETQTPVDTILKDLVDREVVECEREHYYRIRVGLFKEWLMAH